MMELRKLYPETMELKDGGKTIPLLPNVLFHGDGQDQRMDLLLYPYEHSGYTTRLFFKKPLACGSNWAQHMVCEEPWWAPSFQGVQADQPWYRILARHLRAVA
jgi:hypothetical protein